MLFYCLKAAHFHAELNGVFEDDQVESINILNKGCSFEQWSNLKNKVLFDCLNEDTLEIVLSQPYALYRYDILLEFCPEDPTVAAALLDTELFAWAIDGDIEYVKEALKVAISDTYLQHFVIECVLDDANLHVGLELIGDVGHQVCLEIIGIDSHIQSFSHDLLIPLSKNWLLVFIGLLGQDHLSL